MERGETDVLHFLFAKDEALIGEVLSDCGISAVGIVDPDALPNSERPSPAALSTVTAAALLVRFFLEACLTRRMVASFLLLNALRVTSLRWAKGARKVYLRVIK
jgi:hypothetical protein